MSERQEPMTSNEFNRLCVEACRGFNALDSSEDVWRAICTKVNHFFGREYVHEQKELSVIEDCKNQLRGFARRGQPDHAEAFDAVGIAQKHVDDAADGTLK